DGNEHVVGHCAVAALNHQVEDVIVGEELVRLVIGDVAEEETEAHEGERGREPHHDHDHDEAEHRQPECWIAHLFKSPPMPRWRAISSISFARSIAILRDSSSTYSLCASC